MRHTGTVLVVEDDELLSELLHAGLRSAGYTVLDAADRDTAAELLAARPEIQVMVCDITMPGECSGAELMQRAKSREPAVRVVGISGYPADRVPDNQANSADEFLGKPFALSMLADCVCRQLKKR